MKKKTLGEKNLIRRAMPPQAESENRRAEKNGQKEKQCNTESETCKLFVGLRVLSDPFFGSERVSLPEKRKPLD